MAGEGMPATRPGERDGLGALAGHLRALANERRLRLLDFLAEPRRMQEVEQHLGIARANAQEHVDRLVDVGVVRRSGQGPGPGYAPEFVVVPERLFGIQEDFARVARAPAPPDQALFLATERLRGEVAAPRERDLPRLVVVHGRRVGAATALEGTGPWLLGRDPGAHLRLDYDLAVSLRHAEVRRVPGGFALADLYSSNGTLLDWRRLDRGAEVPVANGQVVQVGRSLVLFRHGP